MDTLGAWNELRRGRPPLADGLTMTRVTVSVTAEQLRWVQRMGGSQVVRRLVEAEMEREKALEASAR